MSRKIVILELTPNHGIISFDRSLNKQTYLFHDWDEPYLSRILRGEEFFIINRCINPALAFSNHYVLLGIQSMILIEIETVMYSVHSGSFLFRFI